AQTISTVALAKGAAAGGATVTLVKGALKVMAWTKAKTAIAVTAAALLAAGTTTVVIRDVYPIQEPTYAGRSLTEWLGDSGNAFSQRGPQQAAAEDAIRHIGTSALPFLINDLIWDPKLRRHRLHPVRPDTRLPDVRCVQAIRGFEILGSLAKPAIPDLVKLLEQNPGYVPIALAGIGRDAVPQLEQALTNSSFFVRDNTAAGLANAVFAGRIPPTDLENIIPLAANNVAYTNTNTLFEVNTRHRAAGLLGAIHLAPEISVPALAGGLQDSHITVAIQCADSLGRFGAEGKTATPELINAVASTNSQLSGAACSALSFIDPDTLAGDVLRQTIYLATNADVGVQMQTIQALGRRGPRASEAIPALIAKLGDANEVIRMVAAQNLGLIAQQPNLTVPALSRALRDSSFIVRSESIKALAKFGWKARETVPTLLAMAKAEPGLKGNVQIALEKIDRNAAAALK
ncbi:MAG TPA: HEAT repeat domain-containing protein, partial [Verrucomicrobiae bacterium]